MPAMYEPARVFILHPNGDETEIGTALKTEFIGYWNEPRDAPTILTPGSFDMTVRTRMTVRQQRAFRKLIGAPSDRRIARRAHHRKLKRGR